MPKMTKQAELGIGIATGAEPPSVDITSSPEDRIRKLMSQIEPMVAKQLPTDPVAREQALRRIATENLHFSVLNEQASFGGFRS